MLYIIIKLLLFTHVILANEIITKIKLNEEDKIENVLNEYSKTLTDYEIKLTTSNTCNEDKNLTIESPLCLLSVNCDNDCNNLKFVNTTTEECYLLIYNKSWIDSSEQESEPETWLIWIIAFSSVTFINLSAIMGVFFMPMFGKSFFDTLMYFLVSLGVGALSASSLFQLIPESFELYNTETINYTNRGFFIWLSVFIFFVLDSIGKIILKYREDSRKKVRVAKFKSNLKTIEEDNLFPKSNLNEITLDISATDGSQNTLQKNKIHHLSHDILNIDKTTISSVAWMIIFGDGLHNFLDGLSIGAGFNENIGTGLSISLAVVCEEFPHELGDFAILINAGMSPKKAIFYNFLSALSAYVGLFIGLLIKSLHINFYIFGFTAGLFLYVSLANLIPELKTMLDKSLDISIKQGIITVILQALGMLTGMTLLYLISVYGYLIEF